MKKTLMEDINSNTIGEIERSWLRKPIFILTFPLVFIIICGIWFGEVIRLVVDDQDSIRLFKEDIKGMLDGYKGDS